MICDCVHVTQFTVDINSQYLTLPVNKVNINYICYCGYQDLKKIPIIQTILDSYTVFVKDLQHLWNAWNAAKKSPTKWILLSRTYIFNAIIWTSIKIKTIKDRKIRKI